MQIAQTMAGFSLAKADDFRRAISKKDNESMLALKQAFLEGAVSKGYKSDHALSVYNHILKFADYGFNKSHSVAYATLTYQMAYLKTCRLNKEVRLFQKVKLKICLINLDPSEAVSLPAGSRIAQLVVQEVSTALFTQVQVLDNTERSDQGFGSTGLTPSTAATGAVSVAGTLAVANGGTGNTTYSSGQLLIGSSSTGSLVRSTLTAGSGISITNGNGSITIAASGTAGVSSISFGSTGLTPSTSSTGAVSVAGTLAVGSGGTGATTAANARTNLGLGTISTQAANSVSITGGSIEGLSTLRMTGQSYNPVANGSLNVTATTSFSVNATGLVHFASGIGNFATSTSVFQLQSGITPQAFGTTTWTNISDERIKKNLANYTFGLTELRQLQTVTYQFNGLYGSADDGKVNVGLIAQDVAETSFSSMVEPWKYTDPVSGEVTDLLSVNTSQLVFALINAVKELDARIKVLEARVV
jgi:hypothetical protein